MKFILFLMFFTAPPGNGDNTQLWELQSTSSMEFESEDACDEAASKLIGAVQLTETIKLFGWCFPSNSAGGGNKPAKHKPPMPEFYSDKPIKKAD